MHLGHDHIGQQQADFFFVLAGQFDGFAGAARLQHLVALFLEKVADHAPKTVLIFNQQDCLRALHRPRPNQRYINHLDRLQHPRQVDLKCGAHAGFTMNGNGAAGLLHDPIHGEQAQTCSLALLLGGEEWLKDVGLYLWRNSASGVAD